MKDCEPRPESGASVHTDWYGWLPEAKLQAFRVYAHEFEAYYLMFSVSLNEAISLRDCGSLRKSFQLIDVTPGYCSRFAVRLHALLAALDEHAKHYGIIPSVVPLSAANFQGVRGQRSARMNMVLSSVLLSQRAQFLSKIGFLKDMVTELDNDFRGAATKLANGMNLDNNALWAILDHDQYDLNTCFRESMILLKCYLRALPDDQLLRFQKTVADQMNPRKPVSEHRVIRHRRTPLFAGE